MRDITMNEFIENLKKQMQDTNADFVHMSLSFKDSPYQFSCSLSKVDEEDKEEETE